jgi:hypothetical protein
MSWVEAWHLASVIDFYGSCRQYVVIVLIPASLVLPVAFGVYVLVPESVNVLQSIGIYIWKEL